MSNDNKELVTISDISRLAGVSKSTVSRYLNGGSISKKTTDKIKKIVHETNYSPNSFAQSLKAKKNNLIGTIVPRLDSYSIVQSLAGMDQEFAEKKYELLILNTYQSPERELEALQTFKKQKVAGIVFFATILKDEHIQLLKSLDVPIIILGQEVEDYHNVLYSDYEAGYKIGQYAHQLGHRSITYLGVTEADRSVGHSRKKGVFDALQLFDIHPDYYETTFQTKDAYKLSLKLLPHNESTYIICATDNIALGVLKAARELNIEIPQDISISGFGGYDITDAVTPTITTVKYAYQKAGHVTANSIIRLVNKEEVANVTLIENHVEIKNSTTFLI